ncbi:hypothetical protein MMC30_004833 [Trapelia coarctata]|nr:hypothetical protein [Trapelia coarctata]
MCNTPLPPWLLVLVLLFSCVCQIDAYAGFVVVTIERVIAHDDFDPGAIFGIGRSDADFYADVNIDGRDENNRDNYIGDEDDISPNWKFSKAVDLSRSFAVSISIGDVDGFLRGGDDTADINPQGGSTLTLQINPSPCQISGPVSGNCGDLLVATGNSYPKAEIRFRIEIQDLASFPSLPWDVVPADPAISESFDPNHLLLNPRWGWQTQATTSAASFGSCSSVAACTQQFPKNDYPGWSVPFVCHSNIFGANGDGHTNWEVVTYRGPINWGGHQSAFYQDDDYNIELDTPTTNGFASGGTSDNTKSLELEFKASESIDHFGQTPYWKNFRDAVDDDDSNPNHVNGQEAIVIGLLGLDRVHGAKSELHPAYAMAIHVKTDPSDDQWAIFARNFGNEGMCSGDMHYADFRTLTFQLPRLAGVAANVKPRVVSSNFFGNAASTTNVFVDANQDTFISFGMNPTPNNGDEGDRISGELHLSWVPQGTPRRSQVSINETSEIHALAPRADEGDPEDVLGELYDSLTPAQKEIYLAIAPLQPPRTDDSIPRPVNILSGKPAPAATKPPLFAAKNPLQEQRQRGILNGFCGSFSGQLPPDHAASCDDLLPFTRLVHTGQEGSTGWYTNPVTITLIAIDTSGKGIDHTEYQIGSQSFIRYSSPFALPQGVSTVSYRSQDRAGRFEVTKQATFRVDTIAPQSSLAIGLPQYDAGPPVIISSATPLTLTGTDSGSGVSSVSYRFFPDGTAPNAYTRIPGSSVQFKLTGPDGVYQVDTLVTDVAGNTLTQSRKIRLSNSADLAIVSVGVVSPPPPFVVVGSPIQLVVRTILVNLGFVHPVDGILNRKVVDTADVTLTPKDVTQTETALEWKVQRTRDQSYTAACQKKGSNTVTFTSRLDLSPTPGISDNDLSNNQKTLTISISCKLPWQPGVLYHIGDEAVFNGLLYVCRQTHTSQPDWTPPATYALWARIPVTDEWAVQVIYKTGEVVVFEGHHYKAIQGHQALSVWTPPVVPALWQRLD